MRKDKRERLERKGWKIGSADDFLQLSPEESAYIELKIKLSENLKRLRTEKDLTQVDLAKLLHSSQSRIAKIEAGDPTVSLDLIIKSLLALGTSKKQLARAIAS